MPRASITLLTALHLSDKVIVPVPHPAAYPLAELWWAAGVGEAPGGFIDYARFPCVADGAKAAAKLGFTRALLEPRRPRRVSRVSLSGSRAPGAARGAPSQAEAREVEA